MIRRAAALAATLLLQAPLAPLGAAPEPTPKPAAKPPAAAAPSAKPSAAPAPLSATASASAPLAQPASPPFVVPAPTGKMEIPAGQQKVRIEDKVSKSHPISYSFVSPGGNQFFWIGVTSPKNDVYLSAFDYATKQPIAGTLPTDKAARVLLAFGKPTELLFVAHTDSEGTPFRFEVTVGELQL